MKQIPLKQKTTATLVASITAVLTGLAAINAQTIPADYSASLYEAIPNPTGIATGFWANYDRQDEVIEAFGHRQVDRVGFTKWSQVEKTKGTYTWNGTLTHYIKSKKSGAKVIAGVNVAHSLNVNPKGMSAIAPDYPQRITDPVTRSAAKKFLRAFVQKMLNEIGSFTLMIDYEMTWFYDTTIVSNRNEYRDWYVDAAAVARQAAADLGKSDQLKLAVCVTGRVVENANELLGGGPASNHQSQQWLLDCIDKSDILAVDLYNFDPKKPVNADFMITEMKFWRDKYAGSKELWITELGYSTIRTAKPDYQLKPWELLKAHGTESQQASFYSDFFSKLTSPNGLGTRVRVVCIWSFEDQYPYGHADATAGHYYGMFQKGSYTSKPAGATVDGVFKSWSNNSTLRPSNHVFHSSVTSSLLNPGTTLSVPFTDGVKHHYIKGEFSLPSGTSPVRFNITTVNSCNVILKINNDTLPIIDTEGATSHAIDISSFVKRGQKNYFKLLLTRQNLPATISVKTAYPTY